MNMNWRRSQTDPNYSVSPEVNDRVNLLFNQGLRGSQLSTGGYPGMSMASGPGQNLAGAFGGRVVPTYNGMVAHPMALNAAPMAQGPRQQGDPGLWFNQPRQGFKAGAFAFDNPTFGSSNVTLNGNGGVRLTGNNFGKTGGYADAMETARLFQAMGGKGAAIMPNGSVQMNGRAIDDKGMFNALVNQRIANRQGREAQIAQNARVRNAMGDAQGGNLGPLMAAAQAGLVKLPQQGQGGQQGPGMKFVTDNALAMLEGLNPQQKVQMISAIANGLESGDMQGMMAAMGQAGQMQTRNAEVAKKARGSEPNVQPADLQEAAGHGDGDAAFRAMTASGMQRDRAVAAIAQTYPGWKPQWAGFHEYVDPKTGKVDSYTNHPWVQALTGGGQFGTAWNAFFGRNPGANPGKSVAENIAGAMPSMPAPPQTGYSQTPNYQAAPQRPAPQQPIVPKNMRPLFPGNTGRLGRGGWQPSW